MSEEKEREWELYWDGHLVPNSRGADLKPALKEILKRKLDMNGLGVSNDPGLVYGFERWLNKKFDTRFEMFWYMYRVDNWKDVLLDEFTSEFLCIYMDVAGNYCGGDNFKIEARQVKEDSE